MDQLEKFFIVTKKQKISKFFFTFLPKNINFSKKKSLNSLYFMDQPGTTNKKNSKTFL